MSTPPAFDWRNPDYGPVHAERSARLAYVADPELRAMMLQLYTADPIACIQHWAWSHDPRGPERGQPATFPLVLFPAQEGLLAFILDRLAAREPGLIEKSRDCGASVLVMALAAVLCMYRPGTIVTVGSRKEDSLDRVGDPTTLLAKARFFLEHLPPQIVTAWTSAHLRITFANGSAIVGEAGDNIGRGGRSTLAILDESGHLEHPKLVDAALASNTDCRIDVSTPRGMANSFAEKRHSGRYPVYTLPWTKDPRKDAAWYAKQLELLDPVTVAQEIDLSYTASAEALIIPAAWARAAVDAHLKLGIQPSGIRSGSLDVADEGRDRNAFAARHGVVVNNLQTWSGAGSDLYATAERAIRLCDAWGLESWSFDSDGLGAGIRGDAERINERRRGEGYRVYRCEPFRASAAVEDPERTVEGTATRAKDYFANRKAQGWFELRRRFSETYRALNGAEDVDPDDCISLSSGIGKELDRLLVELSMPQWKQSAAGKVLVDKAPDGVSSPNAADAVMALLCSRRRGLRISDDALVCADAYGDIGLDWVPLPRARKLPARRVEAKREMETCTTCGGTGRFGFDRETFVERTCYSCDGERFVPKRH
jgi:hypothetical protein